MADVIDVRDLPEDEVMFLKKLVDFLKEKATREKAGEEEEIQLAAWPLGVKGKITRREIYDYL